ncbi:MFS transporter [Kineococcus sp. SYSU DK001]|uniref:MFS transporter n=1 Tax=Kineococcus sp. SYSU DK001 TaxID=3383122 RepID=UPI003D7CBB58
MTSAAARTAGPADPGSPWAPLRGKVFRVLWIASFVSNVGAWMQTVGAQWFLLDAHAGSTLVALVQSATSLPVFLLTLPAGVLAEFLDRRRVLLAVQCFQVVLTALLCLLTFSGHLTPTALLLTTFLLGCGSAVQMPAYQALVPTLVAPGQIGAAASLSSIGVNLARAVGPAVAGLLVGSLGVGGLFALNGLTFAVFVVALVSVPGRTGAHPGGPHPRFVQGLQAGGRYVRHSPFVRRAMLRLVLFVVPANVLWALLPLVARQRLGLGSAGYGLLLAAAGVGAVAGALLAPRLARVLDPTARLAWSGVVFGVGMVVLGTGRSLPLALVTLLPVGVAWIVVIAGLNSAVQASLPPWVRARALSIYQVVLFSATAAGAALWGVAAQRFGLPQAFGAAGVLLLAGAVSVRWWRLHELAAGAREVVDHWPSLDVAAPGAPGPADRQDAHAGPVLVQIRYEVAPGRLPEFLSAAGPVEHSRRRTGALSWDLYRCADEPGVLVEQFSVADWDDHLAQHRERLTRTDQQDQERLRAAATRVGPARHLVHVPRP